MSDDPRPEMADNPGPQAAGGEPSDSLTPRQSKAISVLLVEPTHARAALVAGVGERTLRRWLGIEKFKRALLQARREAFGLATGVMQRAAPAAVGALLKVMTDPIAPPHAKVSAAVAVLKFGRDAIELEELAQRMETLEQTVAHQQNHQQMGSWTDSWRS